MTDRGGGLATATIERALASGELLGAYDAASHALAEGATDPRVRYLRTLALARMGETREALREIDQMANDARDEDTLALRGRILKDLALEAPQSQRGALFRVASDAYMNAHTVAGGYFSLINAATLALLAGRGSEARELGIVVLSDPAVVDGDSFYALATAGEALVLLGDIDRASERFAAALRAPDATLAARAGTARQLDLIAQQTGRADLAELAASLRPPPVMYYTGHMFQPDQAVEAAIGAHIGRTLEQHGIEIAFGAAAAGTDIVVAEQVLARGGELNLILPFPAQNFVQSSVAPFGDAWCPRFDAVLAGAASVQLATTATYVGDGHQFDHGNQVAMGRACLRAQHLATDTMLLAVQDSGRDKRSGGTRSAVATWRASGRRAATIDSGPIDRAPCHASSDTAVQVDMMSAKRETRSLIFTDFSGFSRLSEHHMPHFIDDIMGRMATALAANAQDVMHRNTWGDALFAVVRTPTAAAELALDLAECLNGVDFTEFGLPASAGLRIGVHHGPIYSTVDPITAKRGFFGSEVTFAARLEPVTPVGKVYATQSFAAILALAGNHRFKCQYVGPVPLAKSYGTLPMYRLTRGRAGAA